jgi:hypothetical protein
MESVLLEAIQVNLDDIHQLAVARAEAVRKQVSEVNGIPVERVFIVEAEDPAQLALDTGQPKVIFKLE